jgi:hypothetical protein
LAETSFEDREADERIEVSTDGHDQLTKYLTDAHSIEEQALAQLRTAPDIAGDEERGRRIAPRRRPRRP